MRIGVISADSASESRVALTPDAVKKLRKLGFEVVIQSGAGQAAYYADELYQAAGADIASNSTEVVSQSQIITNHLIVEYKSIELFYLIWMYLCSLLLVLLSLHCCL